jgi:hypothetical protein
MLMPGSPHTARPACLHWPREPWSSMAAAMRRAQLARPTNTNLHALDGCPPRSVGTGARFNAHEIASTLTGHGLAEARNDRPGRRAQILTPPPLMATSRRPTGARLPAARPWLSLCLIRPRPQLFNSVLARGIMAGHVRPQTRVNAGQQCRKACWVQALASSNLASSAKLTSTDANGADGEQLPAARHGRAIRPRCAGSPRSAGPRFDKPGIRSRKAPGRPAGYARRGAQSAAASKG